MLRGLSVLCVLIGLLALTGAVPEAAAYRDVPVRFWFSVLLIGASLSLVAAGASLWPGSTAGVRRAINLLVFATAVHSVGAVTRVLGILATLICVVIPLIILLALWRRRAARLAT